MKPFIYRTVFIVFSIFLYSCDGDTNNVESSESDTITTTISQVPPPTLKEISIQNGRELFKKNCAVCHVMGRSNITGPGMYGVTSRVPQPYDKWLLKYIKNNVAVLKSGDSYARKVYESSHRTAMTVFDSILTDNQINDIINYLANPPKAIPQYD